MTATLQDVRTWEELADLYGKVAHDSEAERIVIGEIARRERSERQRGQWAALRSEWEEAAHAQMIAASHECRGRLVDTRHGHAPAWVTDWHLWTCTPTQAERWASEELRGYWADRPRVGLGDYRGRIAQGKRIQLDERERDAARDTTEGVTMIDADQDIAVQQAAKVAKFQEMGAKRAVELRQQSAVAVQRAPIDGAETLRYIFTFLKRFAVWNSEAEIVAAALWIAQSHARDAKGMPIWEYCARFAILGASGSGKSRKSRLLGKLAYKGKILVEPTKPSFIDLCAEHHTVVITEADEAFRSPGRSRGILAVINASYEPDRSSSRKQGGQVVDIPLFVPIVLDGIDKVLLSENRPDLRAMMSRAVCVLSREAPAGYRAPRFDAQARTMAELLSQRTSAWMAWEVEDGMANDRPVVPDHLGNRPFSLWEPMFTVALRADKGDPEGLWSTACRDACEELESQFGQADQNEEVKAELDRTMEEWGLE